MHLYDNPLWDSAAVLGERRKAAFTSAETESWRSLERACIRYIQQAKRS